MLYHWKIKSLTFANLFILVNLSINNLDIKVLMRFLMYIGLAVLDISKSLMYDYHYNVMQKHYGDKIELMYTDTGNIFYTYYYY